MSRILEPDRWFKQWKDQRELGVKETAILEELFHDYRESSLFIGIKKLPFPTPGGSSGRFNSELYDLEYDANMALVCSIQITEAFIEIKKDESRGDFRKSMNSCWRLLADSLAVTYVYKANDIMRRLDWLSGVKIDDAEPLTLKEPTRDEIKNVAESLRKSFPGAGKIRNSLAHNIGRSSGTVRDGRSRIGGIQISNWYESEFECSDERGKGFRIDTSLNSAIKLVLSVAEIGKIFSRHNDYPSSNGT